MIQAKELGSLRGLFCIDKPTGMTSNSTLLWMRHRLLDMIQPMDPWIAQANSISTTRQSIKTVAKAGHGGALDKIATGVLVVAFGADTKKLMQFLESDKEYLFTIRFGGFTDTYDIVGRLVQRFPTAHITPELIESLLPRFRGTLMQQTPSYALRKFKGVPLYKRMVEKGEVVNIEPREVTVSELEMVGFDATGKSVLPASIGTETMAGFPNNPEASLEGPTATFRVACSKGYYVRQLAHEIGQAAGSGAVVAALRRVRQGSWDLKQAHSLSKMTDATLLRLLGRGH